MKDIEGITDPVETKAGRILKEDTGKLVPLYQQFTYNIVALLFSVISIIGLVSILFYQYNIQNNSLVNSQLLPLTQAIKQVNTLQKTDKLITDLLQPINANNFVDLHAELVSYNRQLLNQNNLNAQTFQQWFNENSLAEDAVSRIQDSHTRNEQVKQSSIIQLQLMLLTITSVIEKNEVVLAQRFSQLKTGQNEETESISSVNDYAELINHQAQLQQLEGLLASILASFESLNMHRTMADFESLRSQVEQMFIQHQALINSDLGKNMLDINQQFVALEQIIISEQRALAKWQGYIRLAQDYRFKLEAQQAEIRQLLLIPYQYPQDKTKGLIQDVLAKISINLPDKQVVTVLIVTIGFALLLFFYLLWRLRNKIKTKSQQGVNIIKAAMNSELQHLVANCVETQEILNKIKGITTPEHNDDEFQELSLAYQSNLSILSQREKSIEQLTFSIEQLNEDFNTQLAQVFAHENRNYLSIEQALIPIIHQHQQDFLQQDKHNDIEKKSLSTLLISLRQQLIQFQLALALKSGNLVLELNDLNLINELHALTFNKQQEQLINENHLFIRCDENLLCDVKIDIRLFQQLISVFLDITLIECRESQLYFTVQLQDKNAGQQIVHFRGKVKTNSKEVLPRLIAQLVGSQTSLEEVSPLIDVFNMFYDKQHGENITAQLEDDGYQVSFDLPLAMTNSTEAISETSLKNNNIMLASTNNLLVDFIKKIVTSVNGDFESLVRIDSVQQQLNAQRLTRKKVDVLVVASDLAAQHLSAIKTQVLELPQTLQPKIMVLQSANMNVEDFGFYSQTEQVFCKANFLQNIDELIKSDQPDNQLLLPEAFIDNKFSVTNIPVLLAVKAPQQYQNLQRLLALLGFSVQVISHETSQKALWKTGQYCLLVTEYTNTAVEELNHKPVTKPGIFSLTDKLPKIDDKVECDNWHLGKLSANSSLAELIEVLSIWLKPIPNESRLSDSEIKQDVIDKYQPDDELIITEVASIYLDKKPDTAFDFSTYLRNQGTVELAFYMMDDYTQDNHHQLDALIEAIKDKDLASAKLAISALSLNAKIMASSTLQSLCMQWSKLLSGSEIPSSLEKVNTLLKDTREVLVAIDEYAETI